ncbi:phospholipase D family nuclease [Chromobacterium amazonense]|uniref:phospholipase D family nuclease n=1 Tax=Chromobacterium amazonense TaxID=1382803 RepID=UPI0021B77A75|nr:phospholipase D family protein [Chromobacterium amazonense]
MIGALVAPFSFAAPLPASADYEVGFSPKGGSLALVLQGIDGAKSSILVAAYSFTSKPIAESLLNTHKRGVKVQVVADEKSNGKGYSAAQFLANQGVPVRLNGNYAIFHHKFMVIDGQHLETGSFNYSAAAANKNAENVLMLRNVKPLADKYAAEWARLWDEATPLPKAY